MNTEEAKTTITENAAELRRMQEAVYEGVRHRDENEKMHAKWTAACTDFHARFDALAFPGGYEGALQRILDGDEQTLEYALCFLEIRPYFFRSGYMFKDILRKCKRATFSGEQVGRFASILRKYDEWRKQKSL